MNNIVKTAFLLRILLFLLCFQKAQGQSEYSKTPREGFDKLPKIDAKNWQKMPQHPRLLANNGRFKALKKQNDSVSAMLFALLKNSAEQKLVAQNIVYTEGVNNMTTAREVQGRILALALQYRISGDKRCFDKAKQELLQLCALKNWGTGHFLDVGEAALAAGIAFDWLYADFTPDERDKIGQAIATKALLPSLEAKESTNNSAWVNGTFNWNPVCHGGLTVAALAIAEREPELSRRIVERALKNMPIAGAEYAPNGAYPESPSYWAYGTTFYVIAVEALRSALDSAYGLETMEGFLKTADYNNFMVAPTGADYNYSDYHNENFDEPVTLWFARETKRRALMHDELNDLNRLYEVLKTGKTQKTGRNHFLSRHFPFAVLWWQPSLKNKKNDILPLHWTAKGGLPLGVMRSAWGDPNASFIAIKGGTPNMSHGHIDGGSFILEADSVRWAVDLGTENYDKMRAAKLDLWNYNQNSSRWTTFRTGAEGHNILRFNNAKPDVTGYGTIEKLPDTEGVVGNVLDLTSLYKSQVEKVSRTVKLYKNKSMAIEDTWETGKNKVETTFQWLTYAKTTVTEGGILLEQNGKSLHLKIETPDSKIKPVIVIEDVSMPKAPQDSPNPNLSRILIKTTTEAQATGRFLIGIYPSGK